MVFANNAVLQAEMQQQQDAISSLQQEAVQREAQAATENAALRARIQALEQQRNDNESVVLGMTALSGMNSTQNSNVLEQIQALINQM